MFVLILPVLFNLAFLLHALPTTCPRRWSRTHLHSGLCELRSQCQLFPSIHIWVMRLLKDLLQLLQLKGAESCPVSPLLVLARKVDGVSDGVSS